MLRLCFGSGNWGVGIGGCHVLLSAYVSLASVTYSLIFAAFKFDLLAWLPPSAAIPRVVLLLLHKHFPVFVSAKTRKLPLILLSLLRLLLFPFYRVSTEQEIKIYAFLRSRTSAQWLWKKLFCFQSRLRWKNIVSKPHPTCPIFWHAVALVSRDCHIFCASPPELLLTSVSLSRAAPALERPSLISLSLTVSSWTPGSPRSPLRSFSHCDWRGLSCELLVRVGRMVCLLFVESRCGPGEIVSSAQGRGFEAAGGFCNSRLPPLLPSPIVAEPPSSLSPQQREGRGRAGEAQPPFTLLFFCR